jgi:hypothetical protein
MINCCYHSILPIPPIMKMIATFLLVLNTLPVWGTHLVGGYIQVKRIATSLTYEFSVNVYMNEFSGKTAIDQSDSVSFCPGDGSGTQMIARQARILLEGGISLNVYKTTHTYSGTGSGSYTVSTQYINWSSISNLTDAVTRHFYLETTFSPAVINSLPVFQGPTMSSLTVPVNQKPIYNFLAKDAEGDSVAHYFVRIRDGECTKVSQSLSGYSFPNDVAHKGTFKIDTKRGQLTWNAPRKLDLMDLRLWPKSGVRASGSARRSSI